MILWCFVFDTSMNISSWYQTRFPDSIADGSGSRAQYPYTWIFFFSIHSTANRARWFLWNVSAISHMTSVTKRNIDPTGKVGDCSYTPHNHQPLGWIILSGHLRGLGFSQLAPFCSSFPAVPFFLCKLLNRLFGNTANWSVFPDRHAPGIWQGRASGGGHEAKYRKLEVVFSLQLFLMLFV